MSRRLPRVAAAVLTAVALLPLSACADPSDQPDRVVRVAAAADLKYALEEVLALVAEEHPEIRVDVTYGSSGTFVQQIANGAPFDLYLSADLAYPRQLADRGLATAAEVFPYAVGRLVVWTPEGSPVDPGPGLAVLTDRRIRTVAIANPEHAPYGRAAVAALRSAGVYDQVAPKLVLGENVAQAAEFVSSGNAQAGVVALSLVRSDPLRGRGSWVEVPLESYPRLDQGGVVLAGAGDPAAARVVRDTLLGDAGRAILADYGFTLPGT
ncbi:MAG: molybdate ABC transporter substrate-binding protein [Actinomycetia bacterium]|nr:molybdate ABC transporter substrate-binding protein [Actinomycetes bacterium]